MAIIDYLTVAPITFRNFGTHLDKYSPMNGVEFAQMTILILDEQFNQINGRPINENKICKTRKPAADDVQFFSFISAARRYNRSADFPSR